MLLFAALITPVFACAGEWEGLAAGDLLQPKDNEILNALAADKRVNVNAENKEGVSALKAAIAGAREAKAVEAYTNDLRKKAEIEVLIPAEQIAL